MNNEFKGTGGEWEVKHSQSKTAFNIIGTVLGGKYKIARCPYSVYGNPVLDERDKKEAEANAKLMAASKKMMEALQLVVNTDAYKKYIQGGAIDKQVQEALKEAL